MNFENNDDASERPLDLIVSPPVDTWYCDKCGWEIAETQYLEARFDFPCPRCHNSTLSRFHLRKRANEHSSPAAKRSGGA